MKIIILYYNNIKTTVLVKPASKNSVLFVQCAGFSTAYSVTTVRSLMLVMNYDKQAVLDFFSSTNEQIQFLLPPSVLDLFIDTEILRTC